MTAPTVTAWAIKAPDGKIFRSTIAGSEKDSVKKWERSTLAAQWKLAHEGYRCVKVHITEASTEA